MGRNLPARGWCRLAAALTGLAAVSAVGARAEDFDLAKALREAPAGGVVRVPAGVHPGPLVLDRPVTLEGEPGAIIQGPGRGDVIRIEAPDVTVRGLVIQGTGDSLDKENAGITVLAPRATIGSNRLEDVLFGVYLREAHGSTVADNVIRGKPLDLARRGDAIRLWQSHDCLIANNDVLESRDVVIWFSRDVRIVGNRVRHGRYGLHFMYSDSNHIEENDLAYNSVGAYLMYSRNLVLRRNRIRHNRGPSGYGIGLKDMDNAVIEENRITANRIGIYVDNSPPSVDQENIVHRNLIAFNDIGVACLPNVRRNVLWENTFHENQEQVAVLGGGSLEGNRFAANRRGNYWSDYNGFDGDGDGIGDFPYRAESLFENLLDRDPKLRLFVFSPAQQALDLAARAFPVVKPRPKLEDPAPLVRPVPVSAPAPAPLPRWPAGVLGMLLAGTALGLVGLVRTARAAVAASMDDEGGAPAPGAGETTGGPRPVARGPMLQIQGLVKRYGEHEILRSLDLDLAAGEALALWGSNGAGKTTLIKCVLGLVSFDGAVTLDGLDVRARGKEARRRLGYVPQELAFDAAATAAETVAFFARLRGLPVAKAAGILRRVGLEPHAAKPVGTLSGGMKQRLALAVALLGDPPLLVLDEITSNLDAAARRELLRLLQAERDRGRTVLFTSHRIDEVTSLADRVVALEGGRVAVSCRPQELARRLGLRCRLLLKLAPKDVQRTVEVLQDRGLVVQTQGSSLVVEVEPDAKAAPIQWLAQAGIDVLDFDVETQAEQDPPPSREG